MFKKEWIVNVWVVNCVLNSVTIMVLVLSLAEMDSYLTESFNAITRLQQRTKYLEDRVYDLETQGKAVSDEVPK